MSPQGFVPGGGAHRPTLLGGQHLPPPCLLGPNPLSTLTFSSCNLGSAQAQTLAVRLVVAMVSMVHPGFKCG
jgi:hypothetical protein